MDWPDPRADRMRDPVPVEERSAPALVRVLVNGGPSSWQRAGFDCSKAGFRAGEVEVLVGGHSKVPLLVFEPDCGPLDGTAVPGNGSEVGELPAVHPNGVCGVDHVVVSTGGVERTSGLLADAGLELLGDRQAVLGGKQVEQRFHHAGPCLIELVGPSGATGGDPARVWGITFVTSEIESLPALEPAPVASIRDAVQPGRRIATAVPEVGLPTRVAFMDPRTRKTPK